MNIHLNLVPIEAQHQFVIGKTKPSVHFFHNGNSKHVFHEVEVHTFVGEPENLNLTRAVIVGSHLHSSFFDQLSVIQNFMLNQPVSIQGHSMSQLQTLLAETKNKNTRNTTAKAIQKRLSQQELEALPEKWTFAVIPSLQPCLVITHPKLVRCDTIKRQDGVIHWNALYKCRTHEKEEKIREDDFISFTCDPKQVRSYEQRTTGFQASPWPLPLSFVKSLEQVGGNLRPILERDGIVVFPMSSDAVEPYRIHIRNYLSSLMKWPQTEWMDHIPLMNSIHNQKNVKEPLTIELLRRYPKQGYSTHIPSVHGRTGYGFYSKELFMLAQVIAPIVASILHVPGKSLSITSSEIIVKC